jgi:hypothetical protein
VSIASPRVHRHGTPQRDSLGAFENSIPPGQLRPRPAHDSKADNGSSHEN